MKMIKKKDLMNSEKHVTSSTSAVAAANNSHVIGNKVLPITDSTTLATTIISCVSVDKIDRLIIKGDQKIKALSRMKDLFRWAASAKSHNKAKALLLGRKVMQFRNGGAIKAVKMDENEEEISNISESPKISFRWEVESNHSATSSICSSMASTSSNLQRLSLCSSSPVHHRTKGNWITTDSDFVVLEL